MKHMRGSFYAKQRPQGGGNGGTNGFKEPGRKTSLGRYETGP
jgi:hypothetical protein